ncbi:respiratory nitrate reductase subunit gamma [Streptomyces camelliae]|uniref:respiratory nitrate reductase subunit gamma n=1 Tax=Streptomyces camelliae TaxID=3004093 RepID=UPI002FD7F5E2
MPGRPRRVGRGRGGGQTGDRLALVRSVFALRPDIDAMAAAPLSFQLHTLIGMLLFAIWPFTRLVHAFTAPVGYLFRPYIVQRSRTVGVRSQQRRRGWEGSGS